MLDDCSFFFLSVIQYFYLKTSPAQSHSESASASSSAASSPSVPLHTTQIPTPSLSDGDPSHQSDVSDPYALAAAEVESFPLSRLRDIEHAIDAPPPPTVHVHPDAVSLSLSLLLLVM